MYPMMVDLKDKKITVIGGGVVAYRKVHNFLEFGYAVQVIATHFIEDFKHNEEGITKVHRPYEMVDLEGSFIVVAATNDGQCNREIGQYCKRHHILCNVVDQPSLSSFIVPAVVKRGDLVVSISTGGASPLLAKKMKEEIEGYYPEGYEDYVGYLGRLRQMILKAPLTKEEKKQWLYDIVEADLDTLKKWETFGLQSNEHNTIE